MSEDRIESIIDQNMNTNNRKSFRCMMKKQEMLQDRDSGSINGIENSTNIQLNQEIKLIHVRYLPNWE
jgi:hypothetical protein